MDFYQVGENIFQKKSKGIQNYFIISFHDSNHHLFNSKLFHFSYFEDVNEDSTSSEGEDDLDESATETLLKTVEEVDVNSTEKVCEWFEERSKQNSEFSKPSKSFLMDIYTPAEGQTEEELEAEIHRKDTEQMLKNSRAFYEKFLKFAEADFCAPKDTTNDAEEVITDDEDETETNPPEIIAESKENAIRQENRRVDAELDKCTEMFHDYLKSCDNSTEAMDDIDKAIERFCGKSSGKICAISDIESVVFLRFLESNKFS